MHRNDLLSKLRSYRKRWPDEVKMADRLSDFVESNPDCFERSLKIGHVTGSAWVVNKAGTHVLLTHHKKLNMWLQLGGHADGNTDILDAALCEAVEESGFQTLEPVGTEIFDIDIHLIPRHGDIQAHNHHDIRFLFVAKKTEDYVISDESNELKWILMDEINHFTGNNKSIQRMVFKTKWIFS